MLSKCVLACPCHGLAAFRLLGFVRSVQAAVAASELELVGESTADFATEPIDARFKSKDGLVHTEQLAWTQSAPHHCIEWKRLWCSPSFFFDGQGRYSCSPENDAPLDGPSMFFFPV